MEPIEAVVSSGVEEEVEIEPEVPVPVGEETVTVVPVCVTALEEEHL